MVLVDRDYTYDFWALGALPLGVALDLLVGAPRGWPRPVRAIGRLAGLAERGLRVGAARAGGRPRAERLAGVILVLVVVGLVASLVWLVTDLLALVGGPATLIGQGLLIYWALAIRSLANGTLRASESPSLFVARRELSQVVGRETAGIDSAGIQRACVEAIGENINESVVAPLFWLAIFGPAGLWGYQAVHTLAVMVGDRSHRSRDFGWASARLDDLANFLPARVTWLLIALSAALLREDGLASLRIGWHDGGRRLQRNGAWGVAALAGALGVQLGGGLNGRWIGDPLEPVDRRTVRRAVRILIVVALHASALSLAASVLFFSDLFGSLSP